MSLFFCDVEAPMGCGAPSVGHMTEFGAVNYDTNETFHGHDDSKETMEAFEAWIIKTNQGKRPVMVSDNPAFDWQWINCAFWLHLGRNPLGFSARRIGDFFAGCKHDFYQSNGWKHLRDTKHDHNPVHDALGNVEAFRKIIKQYCDRDTT